MSSSSPPTAAPGSHPHTKLPKFIRNQPRDRSHSTAATYTDANGAAIVVPPSANVPPSSASNGAARKLSRGLTKKRSRLFGRGSDSESISKASSSSERERDLPPTTGPSSMATQYSPSSSPPIIVASPTSPSSSSSFPPQRGRRSFQSSRGPPSSFDPGFPSNNGGVLPSNASVTSVSTSFHHRLSDIPGRLSGWLGYHLNPPSPTPPNQSPSATSYPGPTVSHSPGVSPGVSHSQLPSTSAPVNRHSGFLKGSGAKPPGPVERVLRHIWDSDATPDRSEEPIWLLGTQHPGWDRDSDPDRSASASPVSPARPKPIPIPRTPPRDRYPGEQTYPGEPTNQAAAQPPPPPPWPASFHASFSSLIYLTYRSHFKPIPPSQPPLPPPVAQPDSVLPVLPTTATSPNGAPESPRRWLAWVPGSRDLTTDQGWGCMLRTGQMLLANALVGLHLPPLPPQPNYVSTQPFPSPSLPPAPEDRQRFEAYLKILVWFLDDPSVLCPFSVHRLALAGAEMGREVGHWFGPSIAAGSIRMLVNAFPSCGLGVVIPPDQIIHETAVFAASHSPLPASSASQPQLREREKAKQKEEWGDRAVLVLIGLRLGIDCVNPLYYDSVKALFTFPQTVGIAGGRPSSSYYFVGTQGDHLFYLDPHNTRQAVPLRSNMVPPSDPSQPHDPTQLFTLSELRTFHCERVRKMHISGLDPSMLCGFLVKNREEWDDLRARVDELAKGKAPIFTIADAPAAWEMDNVSDVGMESMSDSPDSEPEFDYAEHEHEQRTPTVTGHPRASTSSSAVTEEADEMDDLGMEMDQEPDPAADFDDEWEKTPGPRSPASARSTSTTSTTVMVPFPVEETPSPGPRKESFGHSAVAAMERSGARSHSHSHSRDASPGSPTPETKTHKHKHAESISRKTLPALPPEAHRERERVDAITTAPTVHHHHPVHHHAHHAPAEATEYKRPHRSSHTPRSALGSAASNNDSTEHRADISFSTPSASWEQIEQG